ncbi:acylphosphatase [Candidatus Babeliales bacterium]|nr:acylphosphatase [Candidatus Babeliales bacterium]
MNQCLRITFVVDVGSDILHSLVHKYAKKLSIEGMVQPVTNTMIKIMACGPKEKMDEFLDALHEAVGLKKLHDIQIEPFFKDRDYRGVFRVLE